MISEMNLMQMLMPTKQVQQRLHDCVMQIARLSGLCWVLMFIGCNHSNPYLATQPGGYSPLAQPNGTATANGSLWQNSLAGNNAVNMNMQAATVAQIQELERRARLLDENNRQLTSQIAQVQQQTDLYRERADLLQAQLQDAAKQLEQARVANQRSQQDVLAARSEVNGMQASMRSRGGATLVANSSLQKTADAISSTGIPAVVDGRTIRISIPADQLLQPNSGTLNPQASSILDRLTASLAQHAGRNRIGIEAHTDSGPNPGMSMYQLASMQAAAVMDYMQRRNQLAPSQLFSIAHGPNHPVGDNSSVTGRAQNRRIEIVIYSETI